MIEVVKTKLIKIFLTSLSNLSDQNLLRVISIAENLIKNKDTIFFTKGLKKLIKQKHPSVELFRKTMESLSPKTRKKLLENFFINVGVVAESKRKELKRKLNHGLPMFFVLSPTAKCNLNCVGCYAGEYQKKEGLDFKTIDRLFEQAKELGMYFIVLSGGELFLWPHLFEILKKHSDMYFMMYSNGTLITKDMAKKISEVGNLSVAISVEGLKEETDKRRGVGVFGKVMQAMDNLREAGVLFGYSVTATKLNSEIIGSEKFVDFMISKGASYSWYFQYVPVGKKPDIELMASPEQRNNLRTNLNKIRNSKPIFIGDFWNDGPFVGGCLAGGRDGGYFHINCNGDVEPCVFLQFTVDNIKNKTLLEVLQSPFFQAFRNAQPYTKNKNLLTPCALIDNPEILRKFVKNYGAKPSYNSTSEVVSDPKITQFLDKYAKEMKDLTDPIWEREYGSEKFRDWKTSKRLR